MFPLYQLKCMFSVYIQIKKKYNRLFIYIIKAILSCKQYNISGLNPHRYKVCPACSFYSLQKCIRCFYVICRCFSIAGRPIIRSTQWHKMVEATSNKLEAKLKTYNLTNLVLGSQSIADISVHLLHSLPRRAVNHTAGVVLNMCQRP